MLTTSDRLLILGVIAYSAFIFWLPLGLPYPTYKWWVSEAGPIEIAAPFLWLAAAAVLAVRIRPFTRRTLAFVVLFILFAAREDDLHKRFTSQGIFKLDYYKHGTDPAMVRVIAGMVALFFIGRCIYALIVVSIRFLLREGGLRSRSGKWLAVAWVMLIATKVVDRSKAVLGQIFGITYPPEIDWMVPSFEEGYESLAPVLFMASAWISQAERKYLS